MVPSVNDNAFGIKVIYHNADEVEGDHHIITANPTYDHFKGPLGLITIYCAKYTFNNFTQLVSNFICLPLKRYFKSVFRKMNLPKFAGDYFPNNFSFSTKGIGGQWNDQLFYINKSLFGTACGIATHPLVWIYTFNFMVKYVHGGYPANEVTFVIIPDIIQFMHYTLWYPI